MRPIEFHYRNAVEKELEKQVAEEILEKFDTKTSPITWISNLVIVLKYRKPVQASNGKMSKPMQGNSEKQYELAVRLTCNSRPMNKALRRTRFAMRTIDDLVVAVNGATVFSKLGLIKAFDQMMLAEESWNLTTINTYHYITFVIETDNRAIRLIFKNTKSRPPARIERIALRLSQFDYEVHKPGETNTADYFSRHPSKKTKNEFLEEVRLQQFPLIEKLYFQLFPLRLKCFDGNTVPCFDHKMQCFSFIRYLKFAFSIDITNDLLNSI